MSKTAVIRADRGGECVAWTRACFEDADEIRITKCESGRIRVQVVRKSKLAERPHELWKLAFMQAHVWLAVRLPDVDGATPLPIFLEYRVSSEDIHYDDWFIGFSLLPAKPAMDTRADTLFCERTIQAPLNDLVRRIALAMNGIAITLRVR